MLVADTVEERSRDMVSEFSPEIGYAFGIGLEGADVNWALFMTSEELGLCKPKLTLVWLPRECEEGS